MGRGKGRSGGWGGARGGKRKRIWPGSAGACEHTVANQYLLLVLMHIRMLLENPILDTCAHTHDALFVSTPSSGAVAGTTLTVGNGGVQGGGGIASVGQTVAFQACKGSRACRSAA
eukprot:1143904-Pelagomonas_calceolata.AAC.2